jgi:L-aspartate oxidase
MSPAGPASDRCDVAVVGGGAAGLWVALQAAEAGARVVLLSRTVLSESASFRAQGGLAAALEPGDSPEQHSADTIVAGRGLCRPSAVRVLTEGAPAAVRKLVELGVNFDRNADGSLQLGLEGGHTRRRVVHSRGSESGREITATLARLVGAAELVETRERSSALALWSDEGGCRGVITDSGPLSSGATVLATGGAAALWRRTTNPRGAIGAGPVMAQAAGADLADLELCQFHPTALAIPGSPWDASLITEAVRGEGATLLDRAGNRFTDELAPRDAVATAVLARMQADRTDSVMLDLRGVDPVRFPALFANLVEAGLDPTAAPVPVAPAAHYMMGGIVSDLDGRTSVQGLLAVGECACTGLHGANRLASNSLTECFVFGSRAARAAAEMSGATEPGDGAPSDWRFTAPTQSTRDAVWQLAGPLRNGPELTRLGGDAYPLAAAIGANGEARQESRGAHSREDFPSLDPDFDGIHLVQNQNGEIRHESWL